jgi:hypothetical protein
MVKVHYFAEDVNVTRSSLADALQYYFSILDSKNFSVSLSTK